MESVHTTSIHLRNRAWPTSPKAPCTLFWVLPPTPRAATLLTWQIAFAAFYTLYALESSNRCSSESGFFSWIFYLWDPSMSFLKRISFLKNSFIYFGPCWVLVALRAFLSLIVAGGAPLWLRCAGLFWWLLSLRRTGSLGHAGFRSVARGLSSCSFQALEHRLSSCGAQA